MPLDEDACTCKEVYMNADVEGRVIFCEMFEKARKTYDTWIGSTASHFGQRGTQQCQNHMYFLK